MITYVIISPVRNEELLIEKTIRSVIAQTIRPTEWILVNDGSSDKTAEIIEGYQSQYSWIKLINVADRGYYLPGKGVVETFYKGFNTLSVKDWEYVVKLDCDLEFDPDYFETIFTRFSENPKLGIASGCTYLPVNGRLIMEQAQEDHPVGASKVYKRECWNAFGGMIPVPGWDLADHLAAQMHGWDTRCFHDLKIMHYRLTGSRRNGVWGPKFLQGRFEYRHGYNFFYTLLKSLYHLSSKPFVIGSIAKVSGYLYSAVTREEYLFEEDMRKYMRYKHRKFILSKLKI
jgi:poly-beta-1,6-N-acetyl-D-glucosamine synthase